MCVCGGTLLSRSKDEREKGGTEAETSDKGSVTGMGKSRRGCAGVATLTLEQWLTLRRWWDGGL